MNRTLVYSLCAVTAISFISAASRSAISSGQGTAIVRLQATTPGAAQTGHANLSGTVKAGQFEGVGSGLTGVNADLFDGINSTAFLQSVPVPLSLTGSQANGSIVKGVNTWVGSQAGIGVHGVGNPGGHFDSNVMYGRGVIGRATGTNGSVGGEFTSTSPDGIGVLAYGGHGGYFVANAGNGVGVWGVSQSIGIQGEGNLHGVYGKSNLQAGKFETPTATGIGVYGLATAASGTSIAGLFESDSNTGFGVRAKGATGAILLSYYPDGIGAMGMNRAGGTGVGVGVLGDVISENGIGVKGISNSPTGTSYGGFFVSSSDSGYGVRTAGATGGLFESSSGSGYGIRARGWTGGLFQGDYIGGWFETTSSTGRAINANALATSGATFGVYAATLSGDGKAVYGVVAPSWGFGYGVAGDCINNGYALYAFGDGGASGSKSFRIDHPFDPENKYLLHYSAESPVPQNFYVGNVTTDDKGYAWVELPAYFAEINKNFKYQLTVVDDADSEGFVMAKVSKKIRGAQFQIRTSAPNVELSWRVDADRNDLWVQKHGAPDETEKPEHEKGKYQHPELYGLPKERGMNYRPEEKPVSPPGALQGR